MFRCNMGLIAGAAAGAIALGIVGVALGNTKRARRKRMIRKAVQTAHNMGCAIQKMTAF